MARNYDWLRDEAHNGDVLLVEGRGLIGTGIRMLTGQQFSHVAMLLWLDDATLWVVEMKEGLGYRITPASQWVPEKCDGARLYFGRAPLKVTAAPDLVRTTALQYRGHRYSYWTLATTWVSQILRRPLPNGLVCSTFVQRVWAACGVRFLQTADPGDYMHLANDVTSIEACAAPERTEPAPMTGGRPGPHG
jgi:hypothetical protein